MKFFIVLASLFAATQAQFFGAPAPGATLQAGQNVTVQVIVPIDTVSYMSIKLHDHWLFTNPSRVQKRGKTKSALSLVLLLVDHLLAPHHLQTWVKFCLSGNTSPRA